MVDFDTIWIFMKQIWNPSKIDFMFTHFEVLCHHYITNWTKFTQTHTTKPNINMINV